MLDDLTALIVDESKWPAFSMGLAIVAVGVLLLSMRGGPMASHGRVLVAMNLFFAVLIATMTFGHLLAVTTKLLLGTLEGPIVLFYLIGVLLAVPAGWLLLHTRKLARAELLESRTTLALNSWLVLTVVGLGPHNFPLAAAGLLNIGYQLSGNRRAVRWAIVGVAVTLNAALFAGSVVFFASGQSFEQYSGMR